MQTKTILIEKNNRIWVSSCTSPYNYYLFLSRFAIHDNHLLFFFVSKCTEFVLSQTWAWIFHFIFPCSITCRSRESVVNEIQCCWYQVAFNALCMRFNSLSDKLQAICFMCASPVKNEWHQRKMTFMRVCTSTLFYVWRG